MFDRVDGTVNICQQFKVSFGSNDFGQQRHTETRRGGVVARKNGAYEYLCYT